MELSPQQWSMVAVSSNLLWQFTMPHAACSHVCRCQWRVTLTCHMTDWSMLPIVVQDHTWLSAGQYPVNTGHLQVVRNTRTILSLSWTNLSAYRASDGLSRSQACDITQIGYSLAGQPNHSGIYISSEIYAFTLNRRVKMWPFCWIVRVRWWIPNLTVMVAASSHVHCRMHSCIQNWGHVKCYILGSCSPLTGYTSLAGHGGATPMQQKWDLPN